MCSRFIRPTPYVNGASKVDRTRAVRLLSDVVSPNRKDDESSLLARKSFQVDSSLGTSWDDVPT